MKYNLSYSKTITPKNTNIHRALDLGSFNDERYQDPTKNKIMILGNSFIKGIALQPGSRFSNVLLDTLEKLNLEKESIVLDLSAAGNVIIDNYLLFNDYFKAFDPNIILWFHSIQDINIDKTKAKAIKQILKGDNGSSKKGNEGKDNVKKIEELILYKVKDQKDNQKSIFSLIYRKLEKSRLIFYLKNNLFHEILTLGIKIPYGTFFYLTNNAYNETNDDYKLYKQLIHEVIEKANQNQTEFIFYNMPEFNLLETPQLFKLSNENLEKVFLNKKVTYINGISLFKDYSSAELTSVRTDAHPNELAHKILVKQVFQILKRTNPTILRSKNSFN